MGVKTTEIATKVKFNTNVANKYFELPNFPMKSFSEIIQEEKIQNSIESDDTIPSEEQIKQMQEQMQNFFKGFGN